MMKPRITITGTKPLIGIRSEMSMVDNRTAQLWGSFMPRKAEVRNRINTDLISLQVYPAGYHAAFDPASRFIKWAAVEVSEIAMIPAGMEGFLLPAGLYAVFNYKGLSTDTRIFQYIFTTWLPGSEYELDDRPHFEILGAKYRNGDPESEEEIWIPVKSKQQ